jgi:hypothetical protein
VFRGLAFAADIAAFGKAQQTCCAADARAAALGVLCGSS